LSTQDPTDDNSEPEDMEDLACHQMITELLDQDMSEWNEWTVGFVSDMEQKMIDMEESGEEFDDQTLFTEAQREKIISLWNEYCLGD
jgi:hypothetical protein